MKFVFVSGQRSGRRGSAWKKQKDRLARRSFQNPIRCFDQAAACAFCASRADRLGGKVQRSSTQAFSIAFAARCGFEDAFG